MSYTSSDVKLRWKQKNYQRYVAHLRYDTDQHIIDYIEEHRATGVTQLFREALELYIKENGTTK